MDLSKFIWIIQNRALYFSNLTNFFREDPYEGFYTEADASKSGTFHAWAEQIVLSQIEAKAENQPTAESLVAQLKNYRANFRHEYYVNCWHMNENESHAMWRLYTTTSDAICLQSTYNKLATCLPDYVRLGCVNYIDYARDYIDPTNGYNYVLAKRHSFSHEQELRAVIWSVGDDAKKSANFVEGGCVVPIDPADLADAIYVSPTAPRMLPELVAGLVEKYELPRLPVLRSRAYQAPTY